MNDSHVYPPPAPDDTPLVLDAQGFLRTPFEIAERYGTIAPHDEYDHLRESALAAVAAPHRCPVCGGMVYGHPGPHVSHLEEAAGDPVAVGRLAAVMHDLDALADRRRFENDYTMTADALGPISAPRWRERPALVSVWTAHDTSEAGPTVDGAPATVTIEPVEAGAVLHVASDGPAGLWTVAVALTPESAAALARDLDAAR